MPLDAYRLAVRRREDKASAVVRDRDLFTVNEGMMAPAQQHGVRKVGFSARFPRQGVMNLSMRNRVSTSWISACSIPRNDRTGLSGGEEAFFPAHVEDFPAGRENEARDG